MLSSELFYMVRIVRERAVGINKDMAESISDIVRGIKILNFLFAEMRYCPQKAKELPHHLIASSVC